ncbi:MAG: ribosomal RNA small subunit methyltransferase A [Thermodesulfobacteriota bacterium]|nr:MAG: ribosomal RNA small subunit methyltransferase A [Thermodesulfobacteriota bacterium]RLG11356.1 MAG: ribosomal RNA small subunit methyltransferase A [Candidatus Pacearchaeota archaeon]
MLKKKWGQHLLIAGGILKKLVEFAQIKDEIVVEIGPGPGNLTKELLRTPLKKLYLIEIDPEMIEKLKKSISDKRVIIIHADATKFDFSSLGYKDLKLIGNLPYNVASFIIENTVYFKDYIPFAYYMIQKEVAERLIKGYSWLSVFVRTFYNLKYLMSIPPRFFIPPPKVQSSFIEFKRKDFEEIKDLIKYKKFLTSIFAQKRKILRNKIPENVLYKASINPHSRVEELSINEFIRLFKVFENKN